MDDQPVYLSPVHFQSQPTPTWAGFMHAPSFGATSQGSSNVSDSEEETASVTRSPDSVPHVYMSGPYQPSQMMQQHVHRPMAPSQQTNLFDMDLDEPSTTAADDEDEEEETTVDDELVFDDSMGSDHLDTTVDYSYLHGAVESPLDLDDFPGTKPRTRRICASLFSCFSQVALAAFHSIFLLSRPFFWMPLPS